MKENFAKKVIRNGIVDTKKYRYIAVGIDGADEQHTEIRRISLDLLDTTKAIDGWETVKELH